VSNNSRQQQGKQAARPHKPTDGKGVLDAGRRLHGLDELVEVAEVDGEVELLEEGAPEGLGHARDRQRRRDRVEHGLAHLQQDLGAERQQLSEVLVLLPLACEQEQKATTATRSN
jgi:hypothetical protein